MFSLEERLSRLGLTFDNETDGIQSHEIEVPDVDKLRHILDQGLPPERREADFGTLFDEAGAEQDPLVQRIKAYVLGNGSLGDADRKAAAAAFPLKIYVEAAPQPITISAPHDLSTPGGSMKVAVFSDVTMEAGGYFFCHATPLQFTCTSLSRNGQGGSIGDFNILGATGAEIPAPGGAKAPGRATNGRKGQCSSAGISGKGGGKGATGSPGKTGTNGTRGNDGTPSQFATITCSGTITTPAGQQIIVASRSGTGGTGQPGGPGQPGGKGGNGGDGVSCGCTGNGGGPGGHGGAGGNGGTGGPGGNGVTASGNITINVVSTEISKVKQGGVTAEVPYGGGGAGGPPGAGGRGGNKSSGGKNNSGGSAGGAGGSGATGAPGGSGTVRGKPAVVTVQPL